MHANETRDASDPIAAFLQGSLGREAGLRPQDLDAAFEAAKACLRRGARIEALRIYIALILWRPTDVEAQVGLAGCALELGEHHLALQAASAIVAFAPRDPRGYYLSGRACLGLGEMPEAAEDLTDALALAREQRNAVIGDDARRLLASLDATGAIVRPSAPN